MKKKLFILFLFSSFLLNAQTPISLDISDLGVPVRTYDLRIDTAVTSSIQPGNMGANLTWNFMALHSNLKISSIELISSNAGPYNNFFPLANVAYAYDTILNYHYYNSGPAGLLYYGIVSDYLNNGDSIKVIFSSPDTVLRLPTNYNDICNSIAYGDTKSLCHYSFDTNISGFPVTVPIDTLRIKHFQDKNSVIDAWGSMTTPTDMYPALRQKDLIKSVDSIWGYANVPPPYQSYSGWYPITVIADTSVNYTWWMKGLGIPAIKMYMYKTTSLILRVEWIRNVFYGTHENEMLLTNVFPNPAQDFLHFTINDINSEVVIYDVMGKEILKQNVQNNNSFTISVADFPDGMYFYTVFKRNEKTSGKFVVKH